MLFSLILLDETMKSEKIYRRIRNGKSRSDDWTSLGLALKTCNFQIITDHRGPFVLPLLLSTEALSIKADDLT